MSLEKFQKAKKSYLEGYSKVGPYLGLGAQLAATVILMFFIGKYLDSVLNTYPLLLLVCSLLGAFAGLYNFIRSVLNLSKKKPSDVKD
ncbi:MAG: AtpZ/AtpI family protein [Ignavibacteria bacterium]|nr:AtpZ/AtpI family protein [Ignavibacteria bacterium]